MGKRKKSKENELFTFRRYKKIEGGKVKKGRHPKLIVDKVDDNYGFMGLTEAKSRGHHLNIPLTKNPQKGNNRKAYIRKELRFDNKDNFAEILKDYELTAKDKETILKYLQKKHKKK